MNLYHAIFTANIEKIRKYDIIKAEGQWEYGRKSRDFVLIVFIFKRFVYSGKKFQTTVKAKEMLLCTRSAFR